MIALSWLQTFMAWPACIDRRGWAAVSSTANSTVQTGGVEYLAVAGGCRVRAITSPSLPPCRQGQDPYVCYKFNYSLQTFRILDKLKSFAHTGTKVSCVTFKKISSSYWLQFKTSYYLAFLTCSYAVISKNSFEWLMPLLSPFCSMNMWCKKAWNEISFSLFMVFFSSMRLWTVSRRSIISTRCEYALFDM